MKKLIGLLAALVVGPIVGIGSLLPAAADVSVGGASACAPQSANPHPTDPAGSTSATLFCASATPTASPTPSPTPGKGGTGGGTAGRSGSGGSGGSGTTTTGGSQTTLASSAAGGSASTPSDQGAGSRGPTVAKAAAGSGSPSSGGGLFGGLLGFFSATGGLVFLFGLLVLMAIVLIAVGFVSWLRRGQGDSWASRARSLSFRPKS